VAFRVSDDATAIIGLDFYGGKFVSACVGTDNFFELEVYVFDSLTNQVTGKRSILGVAEDSDLESTLTASALSIIDEFLAQRRQWKAMYPIPTGKVTVTYSTWPTERCTTPLEAPDAILQCEPSIDFPTSAVKARMHGIVYLQGRILENGQVASIEVSRGVNRLIDYAAARGAENFVFQPGRCGGRAVEGAFSATITFSIE
jgi:hypothetical protein